MTQRTQLQYNQQRQYPTVTPHSRISLDTGYLLQALQNLSDKILAQGDRAGEIASLTNDRWAGHLVTLNTYIYFDIDSSRRNRVQYPLASNFVIPYTNASAGSNSFNSSDPVTNAFPYESGLTQTGSTTTIVILAPTSNQLDNFYINSILDIAGQFVRITNYVGSTQTATTTPALTNTPSTGTPYQIRRGIPIAKGTLQPGSTQNTVILPTSFSSIDGYYTGAYILMDSGPAIGQVMLIIAYDGITKLAILGGAFTVSPGTDLFEIDGFSYDNMTPLRYNGSRALNQPVAYAVTLLELSIPNLTLSVGYGGKISNYPYLYVHFYNDTKHTETIIYGNNPAATLATFRVGMNAPSCAAVHLPEPNFFVFDNINLTAPEAMKFSPSESMRFRVTLPNGQDLAFVEPDTSSPSPPNPIVQISALVGVRRIATPPRVESVSM